MALTASLVSVLGLGLGAGCGEGAYSVQSPTTHVMKGKDWRDEVIYQLIVDRFADGDVNNNWRVMYNALGRYQGGDWQGVIDRLDYLEQLGVTAIWISPIVKNVDYDAGFDGYHGYWTQSLTKVNPHFGSPAKLRELVDRAHGRGMKVILDIVANHMSQLFYYDINGNGEPNTIFTGSLSLDNVDELGRLKRNDEYDPDFDPNGVLGENGTGISGPAQIRFLYIPEINRVPPEPIRFGPGDNDVLDFRRAGAWYRKGRVTNYDNEDQLTQGDFPGGLKDLDTQRDYVRKGLIKGYAQLIRDYDFDGFRIDTLKHVEHGFWQEFGKAIRGYVSKTQPIWGVEPLTEPKRNWFMFGEAFDGDDGLLGEFTYNNELESVFYFSQKFEVYDGVVKGSGPTSRAERLWNDRLRFRDGGRLHGKTRTCFNPGRCFRTTRNGPPTPDIAEGKPIYNQEPLEGGPVDPSGQGIPPSRLLVNFLDNHDVARFLSPIAGVTDLEDGLRKLHNALALMFTQDGIPCVYYGTEQEFTGGNDPANRERLFDTVLGNAWLGRSAGQRERLPDSGYDTSKRTYQWIARLSKVRKAYEPLRRGDLKVTWSTDATGSESDAGILAFTRTANGKSALVVTNVHNNKTSETRSGTTVMSTPFSPGTELVEVLKDPFTEAGMEDRYTVQVGGQVTVRVSPRATRVFVPGTDVVTVR